MRNAITTVIIVFGVTTMARADIVKLDLFDLGCPTEFNFDSTYWQTDFDLGIEFVEIDRVYMDWSGEITAGLAMKYDPRTLEPVGEPFPLDVAISAYLGRNPAARLVSIWGGSPAYPEPEVFDYQSEFKVPGSSSWSDLLDGQGKIWVYYEGLISLNGGYIESGSIILDKANFVVEGVIPEPATLYFLGLGGIWMMRKISKR